MSMHDIEHSIGDRLRLPQYRDQFGEELYDSLVVALSEGQPPVYLAEPFLLRQWYAKYKGMTEVESFADFLSVFHVFVPLYRVRCVVRYVIRYAGGDVRLVLGLSSAQRRSG